MNITYLRPRAVELVGYIPYFLPLEEVSAKDQFNRYYKHGGGWDPLPGWVHQGNGRIKYPGDRPLSPIARIDRSNGETIYIYRHAWVMILLPDGSYEVARMD